MSSLRGKQRLAKLDSFTIIKEKIDAMIGALKEESAAEALKEVLLNSAYSFCSFYSCVHIYITAYNRIISIYSYLFFLSAGEEEGLLPRRVPEEQVGQRQEAAAPLEFGCQKRGEFQ